MTVKKKFFYIVSCDFAESFFQIQIKKESKDESIETEQIDFNLIAQELANCGSNQSENQLS